MAKEKEMNLLNVENTQDVSAHAQHDKQKEANIKESGTDKQKDKSSNNKDTKETENTQDNTQTQKEYKSLETYKNSLNPQEKKILEKFMSSPVFDSFVTYLETFFRDKDTIIHRINCYCFRAKNRFK